MELIAKFYDADQEALIEEAEADSTPDGIEDEGPDEEEAESEDLNQNKRQNSQTKNAKSPSDARSKPTAVSHQTQAHPRPSVPLPDSTAHCRGPIMLVTKPG